MPTWTEQTATCEVFTYKAGVLSAVGHDLLFRVGRFELTLEDDAVSAWFDGTTLALVGAMKGGQPAPGALSPKDERDILDNVRNHVFKRHRVERITFSSDRLDDEGDSLQGEGTLTIPPHAHDLDFELQIEGDAAVCELTLHQPHWGITPFKALMGALRIQPEVKVRLRLPWPG